MSPPPGPRIWNVPCGLMDAVLALAFDTGELENLCASTRTPLPCTSSARHAMLRDVVHQACHRPGGGLARRIERTLDLRFAEQKEECRTLGLVEYARQWFFDEPPPTRGFAGALWAIASSSDPDAPSIAARVARYVTFEALDGLRVRVESGARRSGLAPQPSGG